MSRQLPRKAPCSTKNCFISMYYERQMNGAVRERSSLGGRLPIIRGTTAPLNGLSLYEAQFERFPRIKTSSRHNRSAAGRYAAAAISFGLLRAIKPMDRGSSAWTSFSVCVGTGRLGNRGRDRYHLGESAHRFRRSAVQSNYTRELTLKFGNERQLA